MLVFGRKPQAPPVVLALHEKNYRRRRDALIDKKCNLDRRIVAVCRLELERVRPVVVRGSTAAAQAIQ